MLRSVVLPAPLGPITERISPRGTTTHLNMVSGDRKSTRLNSSHLVISYAVFCLKKKKHRLVCFVRSDSHLLSNLVETVVQIHSQPHSLTYRLLSDAPEPYLV